MCTAIATQGAHFYFGRNMDIERRFGECGVMAPRAFVFAFRNGKRMERHHAMIGTAAVVSGTPLFADACNEYGLCMAGLHFPRFAHWLARGQGDGKAEVAPYELIPWILGQCADLFEVRALLARLCVVDIPFSSELPNTPMHWFVCDRTGSLAVEQTVDGLQVYEDPVGVLTNNPPFLFHIQNLGLYRDFDARYTAPTLGGILGEKPICAGLGTVGLPGDLSSPSRFVKAAWLTRTVRPWQEGGEADISTVFSVLSAVAVPRGCVLTDTGEAHYTTYSLVADPRRRSLQWRIYGRATPLDMQLEESDGDRLRIVEFV